MKRITVIGSGSNGLTTAAYLTMRGYEVTLADVEAQLREAIPDGCREIRLRGALGERKVEIAEVTGQVAQAVKDAEMIVICVSVERHEEIGRLICEAICDGQTILFNPGNLGAVKFSKLRPELVKMPGLVMAEMCGCAWACRITGEAETIVALPAGRKRIAAYPAERTEEAVRRISEIFDVVPAKNVLEAALNSPNVITHLCGTLFNVAQVEKKEEEFAFFRDGMSETVVRTFTALERERNDVLRAAGLDIYEESSEGFMRLLMATGTAPQFDIFRSLKGPSSMKHRYMSEDAFCGVSLLVSLAGQCRIPVPLTRSFLTIASSVNECDYYREGYTLENLGFLPSKTA